MSAGYDVCGNFTSIKINNRNVELKSNKGAKNFNFKSIDTRIQSFITNKWSPSTPVDTKALAEAGFYSIGVSDYVTCFYCDGGLFKWEVGDDPWVEHAKWFPDCQFVALNKSQTFVEECRRLAASETQNHSNGSQNSESDPEIYSPVGSYEDESIDSLGFIAVNQWMSSDIVLQLINLNAFPTEVIKTVLTRRWNEERKPFTSFAYLYDAVSQWRSPLEIQILKEPSLNSKFDNENINSISSEEEYNSGNEIPGSQSSVSSTTSILSTYSSSPISSQEEMSSSQCPKSENNRLLCKICLDREIGVVFLPCGHQLACTQCAPCVTDCPICRKLIQGTLRTFFS